MTQSNEATAADRFTLAVWRRLRDTGAPIAEADVATIAADSGLDSDALARRLQGGAELNEDGHLLGLAGLTVADHPHALWFGDHRLSTWCAWDPFFLAPALGGTARLETADPVSGETFAVDFVEGEPTATDDGAVLSMVDRTALRGVDGSGEEGPAVGESIEDVWSSF